MDAGRRLYKSVAVSLQTATTALWPTAGAKTVRSRGNAAAPSLIAWRRVFPAACLAVCLCLVSSGAMAAAFSPPHNMNTPNNTITIDAGAYTLTGVGAAQHAFYNTVGTGGNMTIETDGNLSFDGNSAANPNNTIARGSLIYNEASTLNVGDISFGTNAGAGDISVTGMGTSIGTLSTGNGGAIYSDKGSVAIGNESSTVILSGNQSGGVASVVFTLDDAAGVPGGKVTIRGSSIEIEGNTAALHSGAIYTGKQDADVVIGNSNNFTQTASVSISGNSAGGSGGAIHASWGAVTISARTIKLDDNHANDWGSNTVTGGGSGSGGAILSSRATTIGDANSDVTITNNSAVARGGAIFTSNPFAGGQGLSNVYINGSTIDLSGNKAGLLEDATSGDATADYTLGYVGGGAIYANNSIELNGGAITMSNNEAVLGSGGALEAEGNVTITGSMVASGNKAVSTASYGAPSPGISGGGNGGAIWTGHNVTLDASTGNIEFRNNQAAGSGGAIRAGGDVTLNATGGDIIFQGNTDNDGGAAIWFHNSHENDPNYATATFNAASDRTIIFYDSIKNNITAGGATNLLLDVLKTGAGAVVFDGARGDIYGTTTVQDGAFVVRNNAVYGVNLGTGNSDTSFTVNANATLAGGGTSGVMANQFSLLGVLNISGSSLGLTGHPGAGNNVGGYSTFTITSGQVQFVSGSTIRFNTYLNDGSTQLTDRLILDLNGSTVTGTTTVVVNNTGGAGGQTTSNGIMLVETRNGDSTGAFSLSGSAVVAGAYEYSLYYGGLTANPATDNNWYLRSIYNNPNNPFPPTVPSTPDYREETSYYTALPTMALLYGRNQIGTLHERVGEEDDIHSRTDMNTRTPKTGAWGRIFGTHGKNNGHKQGIYGSSPKYDYDFYGIQAGHDLYREKRENGGRDHIGLYFAYGHTEGNVTHYDGKHGRNKIHAYTLGGYWTYFAESGWYIDALVQGTFYDMDSYAKVARGVDKMNTSSKGFAASLEGGKPFRFEQGWFIEPQAQLIYQAIDMNGTSDNAANVVFNKVYSLLGRVGARFGRTILRNDERHVTMWLRPNIWHEFFGDPITKFISSVDGTIPFRADAGGTSGEINAGVSGQICPAFTVYANASYNVRFDGKGQSYYGQAGFRWNW